MNAEEAGRTSARSRIVDVIVPRLAGDGTHPPPVWTVELLVDLAHPHGRVPVTFTRNLLYSASWWDVGEGSGQLRYARWGAAP